jgi:hypothetical protein
MTFTEAAIEVLRREGKPLHFKKIAEIAVRESLLDHVGKIPEETMADQLAAHCRLPRAERRVAPVQPGTFALVEWGLEEDPAGLDALVEAPPELEPLYRGRERHPVPSRDLARTAGRGEGGRGEGVRTRRRDEDERRGRRFPPPAEVAYEILAGAGRPLGVAEIAALGAERLLMPEAFVRETASLESALLEDNRRREGAGRSPLFQLESGTVTLVAQPEPGERERVVAPVAARVPASLPDVRRTALASLRRRLRECDAPTVEHVAGKLLEKLGFRDLKVAKRGREHVIYTARKRMGVADVRHGIRILRGGAEAGRRDVSDLRRDLGHYGAQLGIVISAGDAAREARTEAVAAGQLPVVLLCGEALAEAFAEAGVGCVPVVVPEVDEGFFKAAAEVAEREEAARRARREERDERDRRDRREPGRREERARGAQGETPAAEAEPEIASSRSVEPVRAEGAPTIVEVPAYRVIAGSEEGDDEGADDGSDEGPEGDEDEGPEEGPGAEVSGSAEANAAAEGAAGERRRRRRRRRRRGGRGRGREGATPAEGGATPEGGAAAAPPGGPTDAPRERQDDVARPAEPSPSPAPPMSGGGDGGSA